MKDIKKLVISIATNASQASSIARTLDSDIKNRTLKDIAQSLRKKKKYLMKENQKDIVNAKKKKLSNALIDRLKLDAKRIEAMCESIDTIIGLEDKTGEVINMRRRPNGLLIGQKRVPIGVIGIIYESRPNVTADTAALCIKSGNVVILKGGSESIYSNRAIYNVIQEALKRNGLPKGLVNFIDTTDRKAVEVLLKQDDAIDLIIPRGGESLVKMVSKNSSIPVIKHDKGLCHIYVDCEADLKMAHDVCVNAKTQKPGVCNAVETILIHKKIAKKFLSLLYADFKKHKVEIRGCAATCKIIKGIKKATDKDWDREYLDLIVSIRIVKNMEEALNHIDRHASNHSEAIVTRDYDRALKFINEVDSSSVFVNASTRFADGYEYGLGAEMGISTNKLHVQGPMGLEALTTLKYIIFGQGQIRT